MNAAALRLSSGTVKVVPLLEARNLVKFVGAGRTRRTLLDGLDLEVQHGEHLAIVGRSGSGKSTLLHLLGALDRPDAGEIVIAGRRVGVSRPGALARTRLRHIGFVFQSFHLIDELTGVENVLMPARLPGARREAGARARELIEELGLTEVKDNLPYELSGGEQQRFAIARALVNDPDVILADEPTGNLDVESGRAVLDLLRRTSSGPRGHAVVMVTHDAQAAHAADRVLHLVDGRLDTQAIAVR